MPVLMLAAFENWVLGGSAKVNIQLLCRRHLICQPVAMRDLVIINNLDPFGIWISRERGVEAGIVCGAVAPTMGKNDCGGSL